MNYVNIIFMIFNYNIYLCAIYVSENFIMFKQFGRIKIINNSYFLYQIN